MFHDRDRLEHRDVAVDQDGHLAVRRYGGDAGGRVRLPQPDHLLLEREARCLQGEPWSHGPGGIGLVADDELHSGLPSGGPCRSAGEAAMAPWTMVKAAGAVQSRSELP